MALKHLAVAENVTGGLPPITGTSLVFVDDSVTIPNGLHLICPDDVDYQTRRQITVKCRQASIDAVSGSYGKDKKTMTMTIPMVLPNGRVVFNTLRLERELHPSLSAELAANINMIGAQLLTTTDVLNFWANGSLS